MSQKKYASLSTLQTFLDNLKETFSALSHKHTISDISDYTVDTELSSTSNNPVANSTLDAEFDAISQAMGVLEQAIDGKADASHTHTISNITNLQTTLDAKVPTSRTINGKALTANISLSASDVGADASGSASTVQENLDTHTSNSNIHFTAAERTKLSGIAAGAQVNTVTGVKGNSESSYRTGNINITKANIGLGNVDNTSDANKPVSTAQQSAIDASLTSANEYTDTAIANLINSAPTTLDTLGEIATAMAENEDVVAALEEAIGTKANASDLTSHTSNKSNPHGVTLAQLGVTATAAELNKMDGVTATAAEINKLDGITATTTELNYVDGVTSNIQTQLNNTVQTVSQTLTDSQQLQARENIGAISGWSEMEDKPFGEVAGAGTLTWDGNTDGLTGISNGSGSYYYFMCDATPTLDDFANGASYTRLMSGTESSANLGLNTSIIEIADGVLIAGNTYIIAEDGITSGSMTFPSKGTYFHWAGNDTYTSSLTIPNYTGFPVTKKIDEKYLPNNIARLSDIPVVPSAVQIITWEDDD